VLGGLQQTPTAWSAVPNCWVFNPEMKLWEEISPMPGARGSAAVGVWDGKIVLAGGLKQIQLVSPYAQDTVDSVSIYDTKAKAWITVEEPAAKIPDTRDHGAAAVIDNRLYIVGGRERGQLSGKNTTLILDLDSLDVGWTISSSRMPTGRSGLAAAPIGTTIYTFGGEGNLELDSGVFNSSEGYEVERNQWAQTERMKVPRHGTAAVAVNGKIYIPGGGTVIGVGPTNHFDCFTLEN
jgi:N-acetylneuraminic acid mutarotase